MIIRLFFERYRYALALTALVIWGALFRLPYLDQFPPAMLQDEAALGYNAMSIATTGKDEWGIQLPLTFKSFGDYKPPVYIYVTALIYKIIGWSESLPRLASALSGIVSIVLFSLWVSEVTKSRRTGILGGILFSSNPWTIHLSRMALEANLGMSLFIGGMLFLDKSQNIKKMSYAIVASFFMVLCAYTFHSFRFIAVVYLAAYFLLNFLQKRSNKSVLLTLIITSCLALPGLFIGTGMTRFNQTSLIKSETIDYIFDANRNSCHVLSLSQNSKVLRTLCSLVWNKYTIPVQIIYESAIRHLSPSFLFFYGDETFNRNPAKSGELYMFLFPFFVYGFLEAVKQKNKNYLVLGFFIAMIPAVLTGPPHSTRLSAQIPFVIFLATLGLESIAKKIKYIKPIAIIILVSSTSLFALRYAFVTNASSQEFLGHSREIAEEVYRYWSSGYTVYLDQDVVSESYIFFAYWNHIDPVLYLATPKKVIVDKWGFTRPVQFGDRLFFEEGDVLTNICTQNPTTKTIYVTNEQLPYKTEKTIVNFSGVYQLASFYDLKVIREASCIKK